MLTLSRPPPGLFKTSPSHNTVQEWLECACCSHVCTPPRHPHQEQHLQWSALPITPTVPIQPSHAKHKPTLDTPVSFMFCDFSHHIKRTPRECPPVQVLVISGGCGGWSGEPPKFNASSMLTKSILLRVSTGFEGGCGEQGDTGRTG